MKLFWWQLTHFQAIPKCKIASRLNFWASPAGKYSWTHPHTRKRKHQNVQNGKLETWWSFTDKKCWLVVELTQIYCWWVQRTQNSISCLTCWLSGCVVMCWTDNKGLSDHDIFIEKIIRLIIMSLSSWAFHWHQLQFNKCVLFFLL